MAPLAVEAEVVEHAWTATSGTRTLHVKQWQQQLVWSKKQKSWIICQESKGHDRTAHGWLDRPNITAINTKHRRYST